MAAARVRAACKALEVDRGRRGKASLVIALVAIAPAMAKPIAHHAVFLKALRKPPAASVPRALRARPVTMPGDPYAFRRCQEASPGRSKAAGA
jgi:hypothetical protein